MELVASRQCCEPAGTKASAARLYEDHLGGGHPGQRALSPEPCGPLPAAAVLPCERSAGEAPPPETASLEGGAGVSFGLDYGNSFWKASERAQCPFPWAAGHSRTCCKCLSPFSFAGLLSEPLLLPDCSFSFSRAVAYARVSCERREHERRESGCAGPPERLPVA